MFQSQGNVIFAFSCQVLDTFQSLAIPTHQAHKISDGPSFGLLPLATLTDFSESFSAFLLAGNS